MLTPEVLKRIKTIELHTRRLVNNTFAGAYHSVFKGQGVIFDSVRPYQPGDDIRDIDWNVTARANEAFVKRYVEERELTVMLMLDVSASVMFGTKNRQKREIAAELGAVLALAAIKNNDRVGLLTFSDKIETFIPPRKGRNHVLRLIRDLLAAPSDHCGTDLGMALQSVNRMLKQHAIIFLLSDFLAPSQQYLQSLMVVSQRHDLIAVVLGDKLETAWPDAGIIPLHDAETGQTQWVDSSSSRWRKDFRSRALRFQENRDNMLNRSGVERIDLSRNDDYIEALTRFFQQRSRRQRG